jgi:hypothetical protein
MTTTTTNGDFTDLNGRQVHAFATEVENVGYSRLKELLLAMLQSGAWRSFRDGVGAYAFLPGEFDYFLSQWGVAREDVMNGVRDLDAKALLEQHMDERRTGEEGYRRPILQARAEIQQRPGRPIAPFGITEAEAKALVDGSRAQRAVHREALGHTVRRFTNSGGTTAKPPSRALPLVERLRRSAARLGDDDLADLIDSLKQEQRRRRRQQP